MEWSFMKKGRRSYEHWNTEESTSKRRKLDVKSRDEQKERNEQNKDDWGDGEEFTQDELDAIDIIASQAINQPQDTVPIPAPAPSVDVSFAVPVTAVQSHVNRSTSSNSDSSAPLRSLSSRSTNETSASLSSHSSSNGKVDNLSEIVQTLQSKLDEERKNTQEKTYLYEGEVKSLRERLRKQEDELEKFRTQRDESYEQQQQLQAEKMLKLQSQLGSLTSQAQFKESEYQSLQEKNNMLQQKLKRLEQQLQSSSGQPDIHLPQSPKLASPRKVPVQPSPPSKQKDMKVAAGSNRNVFPTTHAFMEQTVSASNVSSARSTASNVSCQTSEIPYATKPPQSRRLQLNVGTAHASREVAGPQVVRHLLRVNDSEGTFESRDALEKVQWDPGLVDLLHTMSTTLKIAGLTYSRGKDSTFLSPVKPKKNKQLLRSPGVVDPGDKTVQIVARQNLQLAIEGLTLLLEDTKDKSGQESEMRLITDLTKNIGMYMQEATTSDNSASVNYEREAGTSAGHGHEDIVHTSPGGPGSGRDFLMRKQNSSRKSGAVMLLPLLTNYIQHYVDFIHSSFGRVGGLFTPGQFSFTSPQSLDSLHSFAESSRSSDSSFDSLGSQLGQLLQEGKIYAGSIEGYAITALRCLVLLIRLCQEVGHTIIANYISMTVSIVATSTTSSSSNVGTETEQQSKKTSSSLEADDEHSTSSSEIRVIRDTTNRSQPCLSGLLVDNRVGLTLLHLVMRLAGQDLQDSQSNPDIVKLSLCVLTNLCECCTEDELPKLETIITRGILTNCFRQTKHIPVLIWTQRLLLSLTKSEKLLTRICTKSENCPLYLMHRACSAKSDGMFDLYREFITSLSSLISENRSGLHLLLSNACPCADELVAAVIMVQYNLFSIYKTSESHHQVAVLNTLAQGVILINSLARADSDFAKHQMVVRQQYVRMLSGLLPIMKADRQLWKFHVTALEELCDFEPDPSDTSQESGEEDTMDHT